MILALPDGVRAKRGTREIGYYRPTRNRLSTTPTTNTIVLTRARVEYQQTELTVVPLIVKYYIYLGFL
jgi:hypothetical protein